MINGRFYDNLPPAAATFFHNGVVLGVVAAVLLNLILNRADRSGPLPRPRSYP
jgi:xanthine/uracil permease